MATPNPQHIRVLLVDDHKLVRAGVRLLIETHPQLIVVGEAGNYAEAKALAVSEQPNVILLDLDLGDENGLDFLPELLTIAPQSRIIVLTGLRDIQILIQAVQLGAKGVIHKDQAIDMVLQAIEKVHAGETWFDGTIMAKMLTKLSLGKKDKSNSQDAANLASLTKRERQIISLVCQGLKNQKIADLLFISEGTVRNHLTVIYEKLGAKDRFGLIILANRLGLDVYIP